MLLPVVAGMPGHDHWCVPLCSNRQDRCTNLSIHTFLAKKVSTLGSSVPIGDRKGNTSRFSQRWSLQRALLAYRLPALDKVWRGRGGLSNVLARNRGWDQGQFHRSFRRLQAKAGRAPVAWPTSTRSWWVTPSFVFGCWSSKAWTAATGGYSPEGKFS